VPESVQLNLRALRLPSADLKQQHGLHITLHFLGSIAEEKQDSLIEILTQIRASAFTLKVQGAGVFSSGSIPACLWAGVEKVEGLNTLHRAIGNSLAKFNFKVESRTYKPHITIARLDKANDKKSNQQIAAQFKLNNASFSADFKVTRFVLYCSEIHNNKPHYTSLGVFELY
jgi:2'-5' RNA ligase